MSNPITETGRLQKSNLFKQRMLVSKKLLSRTNPIYSRRGVFDIGEGGEKG
jgi:hypothetical protein